MSVMLCPCIFYVALLMYLFVLFVACLTVFVNCLVKQFTMCGGGALLDRPCMVFHRMCVLCL